MYPQILYPSTIIIDYQILY